MECTREWRLAPWVALVWAAGTGCGGGEELLWESIQAGTLGQPVVVAADEPPSQQLMDDVAAVLAERQALPQVHPELVSPQLSADLRVVDEADVWVTFFSEGAGYRNALGYFTYPEGQPPAAPPPLSVRQSNIIFANASASGSGGELVQGNRRYLGRFPAGTRVGFFLIANACGSTTGCTPSNINYNAPTYYTLDAFNPEASAARQRHVVLVNHAATDRHVLAFEDLNRGSSSDDDFNDVVFVISYNPPTGVAPSGPGIDPEPSCKSIKTRYPSAASGVYRLDPCGSGAVDFYYCDMATPGADGSVGGWTVGGWQPASATTSLGVEDRGEVGSTAWSKRLACLSFSEALVFNKTYDEHFSTTLPAPEPGLTSVPYALGVAGRSFVQGAYGPSDSLVMMGCVRHDYYSTIFPEWGCVTDWTSGGTAQGHIADYALEFNCNPAIYSSTVRWAWANDSTCRYAGVDYTWGLAVR